jgi:hypothetical protein
LVGARSSGGDEYKDGKEIKNIHPNMPQSDYPFGLSRPILGPSLIIVYWVAAAALMQVIWRFVGIEGNIRTLGLAHEDDVKLFSVSLAITRGTLIWCTPDMQKSPGERVGFVLQWDWITLAFVTFAIHSASEGLMIFSICLPLIGVWVGNLPFTAAIPFLMVMVSLIPTAGFIPFLVGLPMTILWGVYRSLE